MLVALAIWMIAFESAAALAQSSATIDLRVPPQPFSMADYDAMIACSLKNHPEESRRYAEYHLNRRDVQTPEMNKQDPDSSLMLAALEGCFQFRSGEPIPFSPDQVVTDWGAAHGVIRRVVVEGPQGALVYDLPTLAACAVKYNPYQARAYVQFQVDGSDRSRTVRSMLLRGLLFPPCVGTGKLTVDHDELGHLIKEEFSSQQVTG